MPPYPPGKMINHYQELAHILERLRTIQHEEDKRHQMHWDLTFATREVLDDIEDQLANELVAYEHGYQ